ncbi:extracellular solute-binding protein [Microbacterium azadirachtae]|uniref:Bacterial extracellular solute-binding protein n=1 Tax=Microbacterium azadirachtae TaxID=582680 RepID=A0A0F0KVU4_9MICO|nr:extracellular solute-binding protein [Microbacterium azadirachtae]KJL24604.1 Bacterial extracellular solute-binding protein [Microbacterium azadirachtae]UXW85879.1 extracellular solute-binding protein [Microbacterium azadirachtae]
MKRSIRIAAIGSMGLAMLLAGCSAPGGSSQDGGVAADGNAHVVAKKLTVWTNAADSDAVRHVYSRFGEKFGVKMNIVEIPADSFETAVQTKWASGDRPDLLEYHATSNFWSLNPAKNLIDLSHMPYVAKSGDTYKYGGSLDGKVYAAITDTPTLFDIFYNKEVFEKNGLSKPKTYADLAKICSTLKTSDPGVTPIFESGGSVWPTQILGGIMYMSSAQKKDNWAQQVIDRKTTFDAPNSPFVDGLAAYKDLQKSGCFNSDATTAKFEDSIAAVAQGKTAMVALHSGFVSTFNEYFGSAKKTDETIGFAAVGADGPTAAWAPALGGTWYVPKTGHADTESTALAFIQYATGEGYQAFVNESGTFPLLKGAKPPTGGYQELSKEIADAYNADSAIAFNSNLVGFGSKFADYLTGLLSGSQTPEPIGENAQKVFEQAAKAAQLPGW